jgi:hypothetical protein
MRTRAWVVASSTFHLTTSSNRVVGIIEEQKLKKHSFKIVRCGIMFVPNFINFRLPMRTCEEVRFGKIRLGWVRLAHAHSGMGSGVINVPPHNLKRPCRRYYRGTKVKNY